MAKCKSCGANIHWSKTVNGKNMPLDTDLVPLWWIDPKTNVAKQFKGVRSHWETCPNAETHRKKAQ